MSVACIECICVVQIKWRPLLSEFSSQCICITVSSVVLNVMNVLCEFSHCMNILELHELHLSLICIVQHCFELFCAMQAMSLNILYIVSMICRRKNVKLHNSKKEGRTNKPMKYANITTIARLTVLFECIQCIY